MTKDDIIRMAGEAGFEADDIDVWITDGYWLKQLERFAALVAAAEREACAKVCDDLERANLYGVKECAAAIRARGEK